MRLTKREREVITWFIEQAKPCPKTHGMSLDFSPTDTIDMKNVLQRVLEKSK